MNLKNCYKYIYLMIFLLVSLAPAALFACNYFGENHSSISEILDNKSSENIEKTETVDFPLLINEQGINTAFDDECEAWLNQNIPYRGNLVTGINAVMSDFLREPTSNVITGSGGWIYSSETVGDYIDTNTLSDEDIQRIGITLSLIQERVEKGGSSFLFAPVPNKNTIYPEYMSVRYVKADENNLERLYGELDDTGVSYVNLKAGLLEKKESGTHGRLYYKRDTHWTVLGAKTGYECMMGRLDREPVSYDGDVATAEHGRTGDLDKLLYPVGQRFEDEYIIENQIDYDGFEFIFPAGVTDTKAQLENFMSDREDHDNNFTTKQRKPSDNSTLYMIRDSFGRALLPFMIDTYNEATFVRTTTPSIEKSISCDDVIYEICERNLKNLILSAPFMYAPRRENHEYIATYFESDLNRCMYEDEGYAYRIFGTIDSEMVGDDGRIYVKLTDEKSQDEIFEAFPILEGELISEGDLASWHNLAGGSNLASDGESAVGGFSLFIDKNDLGSGKYSVKVISGNYESDFDLKITPGSENAGDGSGSDNSGADGSGLYSAADNPYGDENGRHQLSYRGVTFGIGDNINSLKTALGNQAAPSEIVTSCLSGNDAVLYYYPNITMETDMDGNIYYISLMDNSYPDEGKAAATIAGITIGSDKMDIWGKAGTPDKENDKNCIFASEHIFVTYSYKSGMVTSVILEDRKYKNDTEALLSENNESASGVEYESGNTYLYDDEHLIKTGWQLIDGEYYFFDRISGERIVDQTVDGIEIGPDGEVNPSAYEKEKIATMMKAHEIAERNTSPTDTLEEKRRKVFDWVLSFPYHRYRHLRDVYKEEGVEILEANDIFEEGAGDCVSEAAALAFLFHEIGYNDVYWVHDTGHSWVRCNDKLFDPLFAESRDFEANYDAPFTDFRGTMEHSMLIY